MVLVPCADDQYTVTAENTSSKMQEKYGRTTLTPGKILGIVAHT
jgi:hypothetical protein